jgi:hypothetical protein
MLTLAANGDGFGRAAFKGCCPCPPYFFAHHVRRQHAGPIVSQFNGERELRSAQRMYNGVTEWAPLASTKLVGPGSLPTNAGPFGQINASNAAF